MLRRSPAFSVFVRHTLTLRSFAFVLCLFLLLQPPAPGASKASHLQKQNTQSADHPTSQDQQGTQDSRVFVKVIPAPKTQTETDQYREERDKQSSHERWAIVISAILVVIALGQLVVYWYQAIQLRRTVESAGEQSKAMERHIGEAARSATAMENIANVIQGGNAAIIRAYLSVVINDAIYQERAEGLKFEAKPNLVNTGGTPARNVRIRIDAAIVPFAKAETFTYPLPQEVANASAVAAPHQTYNLSAVVKEFVPDADVPDIKQARSEKGALTVWGTVTYDDVFGQSHTTRFAQWLFWYPNKTVYGYYIPGQNDMD